MSTEDTIVTHLAGQPVDYQSESGLLLRQRCSWCGSVLIDVNLSRVSVPVGQEGPYPTWPVGRFVDVDQPDQQGGWQAQNDWTEGPVPASACVRLNPEVTS